jgi:hypothetical protein
MKWLYTIALMFTLLNIKAQDTIVYKHKNRLLEYSLMTISIISQGLGDGLNSRMKYKESHILYATSVLSLVSIPVFVPLSKKDKFKYISTYFLLRYSLFDYSYNIGANRKLNYLGGDNVYDKTVHVLPVQLTNISKLISIGFVVYINK